MTEINYDDPQQMLDAFIEDLEGLLPGEIDGDEAVTVIIFDWFATILGEGKNKPSKFERLTALDHLLPETLAALRSRLLLTISDISDVQFERR